MKRYISLIIIAAAGFVSCRKTPDYGQLSSAFIVSTNLDKSASFSSYKTYYISDTVINLGGTGADTVLLGTGAQSLVDAIKTNMTNKGYVFVPLIAKPDLGLKLGVVKVTNISVYPGWYDGYPGWFPFYWGGYYPYYYPWTTVYSYDTGTLILDAYDIKNAKANGQYKAVWDLTAFGALGSSDNSNITLGVNSINQGFKQSPYLKTN